MRALVPARSSGLLHACKFEGERSLSHLAPPGSAFAATADASAHPDQGRRDRQPPGGRVRPGASGRSSAESSFRPLTTYCSIQDLSVIGSFHTEFKTRKDTNLVWLLSSGVQNMRAGTTRRARRFPSSASTRAAISSGRSRSPQHPLTPDVLVALIGTLLG